MAAPAPVAELPVAVAPPSRQEGRRKGREHVPAGRVFFEGLVAALLLTVGLLSLEAFVPKYTTTSPPVAGLDRAAFPDFGFSIAHPDGWEVTETRYGVSFVSGETIGGESTRGFRVEPVAVAFKKVPADAGDLDRRRFDRHDVIRTGRGTVADRDAYRRVLRADGSRIDQWWVDVSKRPLRVEFWSRLTDEDALVIDRRILDTLELL